MTTQSSEKTIINLQENLKVQYEQRTFLGIISWYVKVKSESLGKDLIISTMEKYDKIYLNGKELISI